MADHRFEVKRADLLRFPSMLAETAARFLRLGYFKQDVRAKVESLLEQRLQGNKLTDAQWKALAGFVAYVEIKDDEDEVEDNADEEE